MNRMGGSKQKFIGEDLLPFCRIVDMDTNGRMRPENLEKIMDAIDSSKFQENTPSAVIALTGPTKKAKFILVNFLLDTLEGKGEKRLHQLAAIEGFDWSHSHRAGNSASIQRFLNIMEAAGNQDDTNTEGIFLWPEPFLVKSHDEKQLAIWIMNVCRKEGTNSEELEEITAMLCSRVMILECSADSIRLRVLDPYRPIPVSSDASYPEPIYLEKICDSSTNEFRCNPLSSDNAEGFTNNANIMRNLSAAKGMSKLLKIVINTMVEETVVATSSETDTDGALHALRIASMKEVIKLTVKKANEHRQQRKECRLKMEQSVENATKQIKERFPRFLKTWMKTQFSMSKKHEILEIYTLLKTEILENYKGTVSTLLWEEFNELVDGRCKTEMEGILKHAFKHVDVLTRLAEQQHQLVGYLHPEKLDEIAKKVLKQVEELAGEGKTLILDVIKLAHDGIAAFYKEDNKKILENEKKLFVQDATTHLGKLYYDQVEKYLSNAASYNPVTLEKVRQNLLARFCEEIESTFKMEEERQEEKARSDMENYLPAAALQLKSTLPHGIAFWIQNHLQLSSVNHMESIYAHVFKGFTEGEEYEKVVNKKLQAEFFSRLDAHCKAECMDTLKSISQPVMNISQVMEEALGLDLDEAKITQITIEVFRHETETIGEGLVLDMIKLAVERLLDIYKREHAISTEGNDVLTAYHDQMVQYMADAPYSPPELYSLHSELAAKLVDAFKKAYHLEKKLEDEAGSSEAVILSSRINRQFEIYKIENEKKITKLQEEAKTAVEKKITQYNEKMEEMLNKYPDGLDVKTLGKFHTTIVTEVKKLLQMELRSKIREKEALENHLKVLQDYIDKYWSTVVEKNEEKMKRTGKKYGEKNRLETQRELQQQQQETAARNKRVFSERASGEHSTASQCSSRNIQDDRALLPPLVFHLQSSRISMAMHVNGHFEILKNESGEEQTPALVVLTPPPESTFIYGTEAIAYSSSTSQLGIYSWSIADFFLDTDSTWSKKVLIHGKKHFITAEFLLAFLLRNLKHAAEEVKDAKCDTALLAVPFWLSSTQRIKVKHAAKIAGFSESYLVNEASAAAFNVILGGGGVRSQGEVLVISENLDRVDTFVYSFTKNDKKVKMIAHSGKYHDRNKQASSIVEASNFYMKDTPFGSRFLFGQNTGNVDTIRAVKDACKVAIDLAAGELCCAKIELHACLCIREHVEKWEKIFETVVRGFGRNAIVIRDENAVLHGAVALSLNCKEIANCIRDKTAYNVLRLTFGGGREIIRRLQDLPVICRMQSFPPGHDMASIYQDILGSQRPIGELSVKGVGYGQTLATILEITNEAIVNMECVVAPSTTAVYGCPVPGEQVHWKTPNLSKEQLDEFADFLKLLVTPSAVKENPALTEARKELLLKCQEMMVRIEVGLYEIKSSLAKTMLLDKISVARQYAEHTSCSLEGIQSQLEGLQKMCHKYTRK